MNRIIPGLKDQGNLSFDPVKWSISPASVSLLTSDGARDQTTHHARTPQATVNGAHSSYPNHSMAQQASHPDANTTTQHHLSHIASHIAVHGHEPSHLAGYGYNYYTSCPYHGPIVGMTYTHQHSGQGLNPMNRFLAEGPGEQNALFIRADTGEVSTSRGCTCSAYVHEQHGGALRSG